MKLIDLVEKYGSVGQAMLQTLGPGILGDSNVFFVDSESPNALDADDGEHGQSWETPLATVDFAVGLCTSNQGDIILVAPTHTETLDAGGAITLDVTSVQVIGLGRDLRRPTFNVATDDSDDPVIAITQPGVRLQNLRFTGMHSGGSSGVISIGASYVELRDLTFTEVSASFELAAKAGGGVIVLDDSAALLRAITLRNLEMRGYNGGNDTSFLVLDDGSHGLRTFLMENCIIDCNFSAPALSLDAGTNAVQQGILRNSLIINRTSSGSAGYCIKLDSGSSLVLDRVSVCGGTEDAAPISDTTGCYGLDALAAEPGRYGIPYPTTASDFSA